MAAPRTARAIARAELTRAILDAATAQLIEVGPAALSVRQVARELGMASSAVYRYFPSRDALLTALIIEAFDDLGQAVEDGDAGADRADLRGRFVAIAHALHDWARAHPHRYALTYGSPVPGYAAPPDTVDPAMRVVRTLLAVLREAQEHDEGGPGTAAPVRPPSAAELAAIEPVRALAGGLDPERTVRALVAWAALIGHVSLELFGHLTNGVLDHDAHFAQLAAQLADDLGLRAAGVTS